MVEKADRRIILERDVKRKTIALVGEVCYGVALQ